MELTSSCPLAGRTAPSRQDRLECLADSSARSCRSSQTPMRHPRPRRAVQDVQSPVQDVHLPRPADCARPQAQGRRAARRPRARPAARPAGRYGSPARRRSAARSRTSFEPGAHVLGALSRSLNLSPRAARCAQLTFPLLQTPDSTAYARPSTTLSSVLSLVRNFVEQPPVPLAGPGHPPPSGPFLSPGGGRAELHYISAHAFSDLTFSVADEHVAAYSGDVGFRQVSADPALPAFFVQTPSLMYGTTAPSGRQLYAAACAALAPGAPQQLVEMCVGPSSPTLRSSSGSAAPLTQLTRARSFVSQTQPAFPILDMQSFPSTDPAVAAQAGVSYGLLTSLLAHSTCYVRPSPSRRARRASLTPLPRRTGPRDPPRAQAPLAPSSPLARRRVPQAYFADPTASASGTRESPAAQPRAEPLGDGTSASASSSTPRRRPPC